jgi:hypothetical protein
VIITREGIIRYWLSEPVRDYREGYFKVFDICFPDLTELSAAERDALRPVMQRHPEYLLEIWCSKKFVN